MSRSAQGCSTGNLPEVSAREENVATFHFLNPVKKPEAQSFSIDGLDL